MTSPARAESGLLVFGDDGSPGADVAWLWVSSHRWPGWQAEILTATPPDFPPPDWDTPSSPVEWSSPHPRMLVAESRLESVRHLTDAIDPRIMLGRRHDADLVVVGPRGLSRIKAMLLGSTTEWLLHHPPAPLAVIRSATPVRRVLACVDGSAHAQAAVEAFARLPWASDAKVLVLGAYDGWSNIEAGFAKAVATLEAEGVEADVLEVREKPTLAILQQAEEMRAHLVVLGTRGLTGWRRLRLGSTAGTVVRASDCSALVACADEPPAEGEA